MFEEEPITQIRNMVVKNFYFNKSFSYFKKMEELLDLELVQDISSIDPKKVLDLTSNNKKAIVKIDTMFFSFLFQNLSCISLFYSRIKNRKVKLYIYEIRKIDKKEQAEWAKLKDFFIEYLLSLEVEFEFLEKDKFEAIKINNFYQLEEAFSPIGVRSLGYRVNNHFTKSDLPPFRKAFVARQKHLVQRIDDDKTLQDFFVAAGFEVIYPENFKTFTDQINYFSECRVIAGISGSGLANNVFMKPGGSVIELLSIFDVPTNEEYPIEIHSFYRIMASVMGHLYFSVSNLSGKTLAFEKNKKALDIIKVL
jgi:hypothetical protein